MTTVTEAYKIAIKLFRDATEAKLGAGKRFADQAIIERHISDLIQSSEEDATSNDDLAQYAVETACHEFSLGGGWEYNPMRYSFNL